MNLKNLAVSALLASAGRVAGFAVNNPNKELRFNTELNSIYKDNKFEPIRSVRKGVGWVKRKADNFLKELFEPKEEEDFLPALKENIFNNYDYMARKHPKEYYIYKDDKDSPNEGYGEHIQIPEKFLSKLVNGQARHINSIDQLIKEIEKDKDKQKTHAQRYDDSLSLEGDSMSL